MTTFTDLKNSRQAHLDSLNKELNKLNSASNREEDNRFWQPTTDKAGNGNAIIRFLPAVENESVPFVRYFTHGFQGPTGLWYIEMCSTTKGGKCPVCDVNRELWNSGSEAKRKQVSKQKRKVTFVSNIMVLKDPASPENEGKVFLYRYGVKIFDKVNELMNPAFEGDKAINPFDFWDGANLRLIIRHVSGYRNYDKSVFEDPSPLSKKDDELKKIWAMQYPLQPFIADELFKPEAELRAQLTRVLGLDRPARAVEEYEEEEVPFDVDEKEEISSKSEDDFDEDFFRKIADMDTKDEALSG
jgi:hypothetical protein